MTAFVLYHRNKIYPNSLSIYRDAFYILRIFCFSFREYWRHGRCCRRKYDSEDSVLYVRSGLGQSLFIPVRDKKTNPPPRFRLKCPTFWNSNALPTWSASLFYFFRFHFTLRQTDKLYLPRLPSCRKSISVQTRNKRATFVRRDYLQILPSKGKFKYNKKQYGVDSLTHVADKQCGKIVTLTVKGCVRVVGCIRTRLLAPYEDFPMCYWLEIEIDSFTGI